MADSDASLLTQAAYAASRKARGLSGGSREAVRKAVDEGRITAFGTDKKVHVELADIEWDRNTRKRLNPQTQTVGNTSDRQPASATLTAGAVLSAPPPAPLPDGYTAARARREIADAAMAEMNYKKLSGELVSAQDVARAAFETGRDLRDALDASVNPLSSELAPITSADEVAAVLRRHNRTIQELLARTAREKIGKSVEDSL